MISVDIRPCYQASFNNLIAPGDHPYVSGRKVIGSVPEPGDNRSVSVQGNLWDALRFCV